MSRGHVATKIHKLFEMIPAENFGPMQKERMAKMKAAAHYVVTEGLSELMERTDVSKSIKAVHEAGIKQLPFPTMVVEFEHLNSFREFITLEQQGEKIRVEYAFIMTSTDPNDPGYSGEVVRRYGVPAGTLFGVMLPEWIEVEIHSEGYLHSLYSDEKVNLHDRSAVGPLFKALTAATTFAMNVAFLCLNMQEVDKEVIQCEKLNKQRRKLGKPEIPGHTSLYIGKVWRRDGTSFTVAPGERKPVRVHMRSAHTRTQRVGKGRTETKLVFIPAVLVNYKEGDELPVLPKRIVYA